MRVSVCKGIKTAEDITLLITQYHAWRAIVCTVWCNVCAQKKEVAPVHDKGCYPDHRGGLLLRHFLPVFHDCIAFSLCCLVKWRVHTNTTAGKKQG